MEADKLDEGNARAVFNKQEAVREERMILEIKMINEIKGEEKIPPWVFPNSTIMATSIKTRWCFWKNTIC